LETETSLVRVQEEQLLEARHVEGEAPRVDEPGQLERLEGTGDTCTALNIAKISKDHLDLVPGESGAGERQVAQCGEVLCKLIDGVGACKFSMERDKSDTMDTIES
jgi:hypothetical protein